MQKKRKRRLESLLAEWFLLVVYDGVPSVHATAKSPQSLLTGMNAFMAKLEVTMRRDPTNFRPRINKLNSIKDTQQKAQGSYFFLDTEA